MQGERTPAADETLVIPLLRAQQLGLPSRVAPARLVDQLAERRTRRGPLGVGLLAVTVLSSLGAYAFADARRPAPIAQPAIARPLVPAVPAPPPTEIACAAARSIGGGVHDEFTARTSRTFVVAARGPTAVALAREPQVAPETDAPLPNTTHLFDDAL